MSAAADRCLCCFCCFLLLLSMQSLPVLTALADLLRAEFGYAAGRDFLRLEGSVSAAQRSNMIAQFNRPGSRAKVGLASSHVC
jgi:SNF2 family DNA or RNA helicase